jgi:serine/threonine protein kinase
VDERIDQVTRLEPGGMFAGYRIEGLIDRGGMGVVYRATDVDLDRTVALKIIAPEHTQNPDAVARFKTEARLAASLEHANIVPIHRGGEFEGVLYLAMRLVPGTNLRKVIDEGPLDMDRIRRVITQVSDALDAAHAAGLVHRDVKPANIMVSGAGKAEHIYLTDFGLTKRLGTAGSLTRTGGWVGTPDYVAPEQIQAGKIDGRADVYSLGCVLYEMLTGSVAFPRDNDVAKLWAHVSDPPPPPSFRRPDLVKAFDDVVARATAKDPDARYQKASDLAAAVDSAVAEQEGKSRADLTEAAAPGPEWTVASQPPEIPMGEGTYVPGASAPGQGSGSPPPQPPSGTGGDFVPQQDPPTPPPQPPAPPPQPPAAGAPEGPPPPPPPAPGDAKGIGRLWPMAAGLALVAGIVAVVVLGSGSSDKGSSKNLGKLVSGPLTRVPTNRVKGIGKASLRLKGNVAEVTLETNGLLNNAPHALHIHGGGAGQCPPASAARLHNGRRAISTTNGGQYYGHPRTSLTTKGPTGPASILAFPRYPATGNIKYRRRIKLIPSALQFVRKNNAVVVVHGIDYNGNGLYDGSLDRSDLDPDIQGETTAPALCGPIRSAKSSSAGVRVYSASLLGQATVPAAFAPICHLRPATG